MDLGDVILFIDAHFPCEKMFHCFANSIADKDKNFYYFLINGEILYIHVKCSYMIVQEEGGYKYLYQSFLENKFT